LEVWLDIGGAGGIFGLVGEGAGAGADGSGGAVAAFVDGAGSIDDRLAAMEVLVAMANACNVGILRSVPGDSSAREAGGR
jgi:hypothetical protein